MDDPPDDEGIVGAVPEAAEQKDQEDIDLGSDLSPAVSAQGEIYVLSEESGQGDMPALPEIVNGERPVRGVEIDRQLHI